MKTGIEIIADERKRQIEVEGFNTQHDMGLCENGLAYAAACYAFAPKFKEKIKQGYELPKEMWPEWWLAKWWKPTPGDRIKELSKAGALIAAEIDKIQAEEKL